MEKKSLIFFFLELLVIFLWLFFIGQMNGVSAIQGDVNLLDEGQYAGWINNILHGKTIYRDFFLPYGPLRFLPELLFVELFGRTIFSVRLGLMFAVFLGIAVALFLLKELKIHPILRSLTAIFIVLIPGIDIRYWVGILCLLFIVRAFEKKSYGIGYLSGILLAITLLQSIEVGIFTLLISCGYISFYMITKGGKKENKLLLKFLTGFLIPVCIFMIIASHGGWISSYLHTTINVITANSGINLANGQGLPNIFSEQHMLMSPIAILKFVISKSMLFYLLLLQLLVLFSIAIIRFILGNNREYDIVIFLIICYSLLCFWNIIGRSGHLFLLLPMVFISTSFFISRIFEKQDSRDQTRKILGIFFCTLFIVYAIRNVAIFRYNYINSFAPKQSLDATVPHVSPIAISTKQAKVIKMLQAFFNNCSKPSDTIFVINNQPGIYFLLDRQNATRYELPYLAYSHEMRQEIVDSLKRIKPLFMIEDKNAWAIDGVSDRKRLPEVFAYMNKAYKKYIMIENYILYKRIDNWRFALNNCTL